MDGPSMDTSSIIGLLVWFACVLYSSIKSTTNSQAARITMTDTVSSVFSASTKFHFPMSARFTSLTPRRAQCLVVRRVQGQGTTRTTG